MSLEIMFPAVYSLSFMCGEGWINEANVGAWMWVKLSELAKTVGMEQHDLLAKFASLGATKKYPGLLLAYAWADRPYFWDSPGTKDDEYLLLVDHLQNPSTVFWASKLGYSFRGLSWQIGRGLMVPTGWARLVVAEVAKEKQLIVESKRLEAANLCW